MTAVATADAQRPSLRLPWSQLAIISVYWFGMSAIWGGYEQFGQKQVELIVGADRVGISLGLLELMGALIAIAVQPTVGTISDYTVSRWGRRKGYILAGSAFDLLFLAGLAVISIPEPPPGAWDGEALGSTQVLVLYVVFFLGLQFSSNFAQGPYQGYVPDLVPDPQVGVASGAMGVMRISGLLVGAMIMAFGAAQNLWGLAILSLGIIELVLAIATFVFVREGAPPGLKGDRSWRAVALEAWGTDVLRERSFVFMSGVRLLFLMGTGIFINVSLIYVERSLGVVDRDERSLWVTGALIVLLIGTVGATMPAAWISNRTGRKPIIWAATLIAAVGIAWIALAPDTAMSMVGILLLGAGTGAYVSVDWALMTEVIPLASSGRYMGLANIATQISGPLGLVLGGLMIDAFRAIGEEPLGPRVGIALGIVALAGAAALLLGVHPQRGPGRDIEQRV